MGVLMGFLKRHLMGVLTSFLKRLVMGFVMGFFLYLGWRDPLLAGLYHMGVMPSTVLLAL